MFSKACEYGIRSVIYITNVSIEGNRASLKEISKEIDSPVAFTAKILQQLVKEKIVQSSKGPSGGFEIPKSLIKKIKLRQIVKTIDGEKFYQGCLVGLKECSDKNPCPIHNQYISIRKSLIELQETTTLEDLALSFKKGQTILKSVPRKRN